MTRITFLFIITIILAGCAAPTPDPALIQTAIAQTQESLPTNTPEPTFTKTSLPTNTSTPEATPTDVIREVRIEVTSPIVRWDFICLHLIPCNLMQITTEHNGTINSCTTAGDRGECEIPFSQVFPAAVGDSVKVTMDSRVQDMTAMCQITVDDEIVSDGSVSGIGSGVCATTIE